MSFDQFLSTKSRAITLMLMTASRQCRCIQIALMEL